jgi:diaminohydroxyphosphoribosylaminopyrimidine deaminase/5-amino-6-(5-phosphoribosylamino)uracil reductase
MQADAYYIQRCLDLAQHGRGRVSPNPLVGAVVLDSRGRKVGEGFHPYAGGPHAEVVALEQAGVAARGGTLYVNLEPCNHTGKTPPCTQAIVNAGIERVICGTLDPNPLVAGQGRDFLQNHRISVRYGFLEAQCRELNAIFFHHITQQRPYVALKLAMTLDGRIATRSGESQWITGPFARHAVHAFRAQYDAILTTAETVLADNPLLTVRDALVGNPPVRVILDRHLRLANREDFHIFNTDDAPTWVFTARGNYHPSLEELNGVKVFEVPMNGVGLDLAEVFKVLYEEGVTSVFVEGGGRLAASLLKHKLVNRLYAFMAGKLMMDTHALSAVAGSLLPRLADAPAFSLTQATPLAGDWLLEGVPA